jgi:hypothetical protein
MLALTGCTEAAVPGQTTLDWTGELTDPDTRERHQLFEARRSRSPSANST